MIVTRTHIIALDKDDKCEVLVENDGDLIQLTVRQGHASITFTATPAIYEDLATKIEQCLIDADVSKGGDV